MLGGNLLMIFVTVGTQDKEFRRIFDMVEEQIKLGNFSEWSTAMILRPISQPSVDVLNNQVFASGLIVDATNTETSYTPTFFGRYQCATYEPVDQYRFNLYSEDGDLIETSGWLKYNTSENVPIDGEESIYSCALKYRFKNILTSDNININITNGIKNYSAILDENKNIIDINLLGN